MITDNIKYGSEEARAEHKSCVDYHTSLVNSRFTIVGLYVASMGFIASTSFKYDTSWDFRAACALLAILITFCLWILELRSRALFTSIAHRGIEIERKYWGLVGEEINSGFFSRQHRIPIDYDTESASQTPRRKTPDRPYLGWSHKPLSVNVSRYVSHSFGLDVLYFGCLLFWSGSLIISVSYWFK